MKRDKESIYDYLLHKIVPIFKNSLTEEKMVTLDGALWDIAYDLCDENAPKTP